MKNLALVLLFSVVSVSVSAQSPIGPCTDLGDVDFGFCDMAMGIAVVNGSCVYVSGCGWEVGGIDYTPAFYTTFEDCEACINSSTPADPCTDVAGVDFGECLAVLGIANYNGSCIWVSGCWYETGGIDYSPAFYETIEECESACFTPQEGCTYQEALNYSPEATVDDGSCDFPPCISECSGDINGDFSVSVQDVLLVLSNFGIICE